MSPDPDRTRALFAACCCTRSASSCCAFCAFSRACSSVFLDFTFVFSASSRAAASFLPAQRQASVSNPVRNACMTMLAGNVA